MPFHYRVTWTVDVMAESPIAAANTAREAQQASHDVQPIFHVQETVSSVPVFMAFDIDVSTGRLAGLDSDSTAHIAALENETMKLASGLIITKAQYRALVRVYARGQSPMAFDAFLSTVQGAIGIDCLVLPWAGMFLGIETDGYTHS